MQGWITVVWKILLTVAVCTVIGGVVYTAVTTFADDNKDKIITPTFSYVQTIEVA